MSVGDFVLLQSGLILKVTNAEQINIAEDAVSLAAVGDTHEVRLAVGSGLDLPQGQTSTGFVNATGPFLAASDWVLFPDTGSLTRIVEVSNPGPNQSAVKVHGMIQLATRQYVDQRIKEIANYETGSF